MPPTGQFNPAAVSQANLQAYFDLHASKEPFHLRQGRAHPGQSGMLTSSFYVPRPQSTVLRPSPDGRATLMLQQDSLVPIIDTGGTFRSDYLFGTRAQLSRTWNLRTSQSSAIREGNRSAQEQLRSLSVPPPTDPVYLGQVDAHDAESSIQACSTNSALRVVRTSTVTDSRQAARLVGRFTNPRAIRLSEAMEVDYPGRPVGISMLPADVVPIPQDYAQLLAMNEALHSEDISQLLPRPQRFVENCIDSADIEFEQELYDFARRLVGDKQEVPPMLPYNVEDRQSAGTLLAASSAQRMRERARMDEGVKAPESPDYFTLLEIDLPSWDQDSGLPELSSDSEASSGQVITYQYLQSVDKHEGVLHHLYSEKQGDEAPGTDYIIPAPPADDQFEATVGRELAAPAPKPTLQRQPIQTAIKPKPKPKPKTNTPGRPATTKTRTPAKQEPEEVVPRHIVGIARCQSARREMGTRVAQTDYSISRRDALFPVSASTYSDYLIDPATISNQEAEPLVINVNTGSPNSGQPARAFLDPTAAGSLYTVSCRRAPVGAQQRFRPRSARARMSLGQDQVTRAMADNIDDHLLGLATVAQFGRDLIPSHDVRNGVVDRNDAVQLVRQVVSRDAACGGEIDEQEATQLVNDALEQIRKPLTVAQRPPSAPATAVRPASRARTPTLGTSRGVSASGNRPATATPLRAKPSSALSARRGSVPQPAPEPPVVQPDPPDPVKERKLQLAKTIVRGMIQPANGTVQSTLSALPLSRLGPDPNPPPPPKKRTVKRRQQQ